MLQFVHNSFLQMMIENEINIKKKHDVESVERGAREVFLIKWSFLVTVNFLHFHTDTHK